MVSELNASSQYKVTALQGQSGVAAGTGDNTEVTSAAVDLQPVGLAGYSSGSVVIAYKTSLTASETLKLTLKRQESADGSTWDTAVVLANAVTLATGALTNSVGVYEYAETFKGLKRYVRYLVTMDCSAGATDVFVYGAAVILAGADRLPA
jgi:predicted transcriptional regulator